MGYGALIIGISMLIVFGGIIPLILAPFAPDINEYEGYLSPIINFIDNGITILGVDLDIFFFLGNFKEYVLMLLQGFSLIPPVLGIPIILITFLSIIYGTVKLFLP